MKETVWGLILWSGTAQRHGLAEGDLVTIAHEGREITAHVRIMDTVNFEHVRRGDCIAGSRPTDLFED